MVNDHRFIDHEHLADKAFPSLAISLLHIAHTYLSHFGQRPATKLGRNLTGYHWIRLNTFFLRVIGGHEFPQRLPADQLGSLSCLPYLGSSTLLPPRNPFGVW